MLSAILRRDSDDAWMPIVGRGDPPLCYATALMCDLGIIQMLLSHGADPNAADMHECVPLENLMKNSTVSVDYRTDAATMLLAKGAILKEEYQSRADAVDRRLGCLLRYYREILCCVELATSE